MKGGITVINRELYLNQLLESKTHVSIKVITGIRSIGKTQLLLSFIESLKNEGVPAENIIYINFDENDNISNYQQLYDFVSAKMTDLEQEIYLIFDEIQNVEGWEKAVNAFFVGSRVDIYIAGSNDDILSKNFLHLLSDNYELIKMHPMTISDYLSAIPNNADKDFDSVCQNYLKFGGLPITTQLQEYVEMLPAVISGIYHNLLTKDIIAPYGVRDAKLLDLLNKFLAKNIGKPINFRKIENYFKNCGRYTTIYTMDNYLNIIDKSGLFRRVKRYDVRARTTVNGSERFYCADLGICNFLLNFADDIDTFAMLENLVCIELWRQGYEIFAGKNGDMQITFVAIKDSTFVYFQLISSIENNSQLKKALSSLQRIPDQYDKIILSADSVTTSNFNGIKHFNIFDFIISQN